MEVSHIPLRHEYKYHLNQGELACLRGVIRALLRPDPNGDEHNEYHIRSLYFDSINNEAFEDKVAGVNHRKKYRLRTYKFRDDNIRLECKSKYNDLISKQSIKIPRELAEQLIAGDPSGLQFMRHPQLHDLFQEMRLNLLRPVVIVDYVREAYIHEAEEVRITFDKQLRTGLGSHDLFNPHIPTYPVFFDMPWEILEIKYNHVLPGYLQKLFSSVCAQRSAISKYVWCRRFENLEY
jgi:hypothetical protein